MSNTVKYLSPKNSDRATGRQTSERIIRKKLTYKQLQLEICSFKQYMDSCAKFIRSPSGTSPKVPQLTHLTQLIGSCEDLLRAVFSVKDPSETVAKDLFRSEIKRPNEALLVSFQYLQREVDELREEVIQSTGKLKNVLSQVGVYTNEEGLGECVEAACTTLLTLKPTLRDKKHFYSRYFRNCSKILADERRHLKELIELPRQKQSVKFKVVALAVRACIRMQQKRPLLGRPTEHWKCLM